MFLRGICVHEDDVVARQDDDGGRHPPPLRGMRAPSTANFLRLAHYPHHERAARIADELGFLLWEEIPVYWIGRFRQSADTYRDAENQLRELIRRDRNRASVILWSVGNETPRHAGAAPLPAGLAEARPRHRSDAPRHRGLHFDGSGKIADRLDPILDVIGINEYFGWYESGPRRARRAPLAAPSPTSP